MVNTTLKTRIQQRNDTAANWRNNSSVKLLDGEIGVETDTHKAKIGGNGATWANIPYLVTDTANAFDYNNLRNKPSIPSLSGYATQAWVRDSAKAHDANLLDGHDGSYYAPKSWVETSARAHRAEDIDFISNKTGIPVAAYSLWPTARANRLSFLPASQILIEESIDGGNTWTDATYSDSTKTGFFSQTRPSLRIPLKNKKKSCDCMIRITITAIRFKNVPENGTCAEKWAAWTKGHTETKFDKDGKPYDVWVSDNYSSGERYCSLDGMFLWLSSNSDRIYCLAERSTGKNPNTWIKERDNFCSGWSGSNFLKLSGNAFGGGSTQTGNCWFRRFTFRTATKAHTFNDAELSETSTTSVQVVNELTAYGSNIWTSANNLMNLDRLYKWDVSQTAIFPANIMMNNNQSVASQTWVRKSAVNEITEDDINATTAQGIYRIYYKNGLVNHLFVSENADKVSQLIIMPKFFRIRDQLKDGSDTWGNWRMTSYTCDGYVPHNSSTMYGPGAIVQDATTQQVYVSLITNNTAKLSDKTAWWPLLQGITNYHKGITYHEGSIVLSDDQAFISLHHDNTADLTDDTVWAPLFSYFAKDSEVLKTSALGANNGVASLDSSGHIPTSQIPGSVNEYQEYANRGAFPTTGAVDRIYLDISTNKSYRWTGSQYAVIGSDLALGETSETAYAGDKGAKNANNIAKAMEEINSLKKDKADKTTLATYLPLAGGTMTGPITLADGDGKGILMSTSANINVKGTSSTVLGFLSGTYTIGHTNYPTQIRGNQLLVDILGNADLLITGASVNDDYVTLGANTPNRSLFLQPNEHGCVNIGGTPNINSKQDLSARLIVNGDIKSTGEIKSNNQTVATQSWVTNTATAHNANLLDNHDSTYFMDKTTTQTATGAKTFTNLTISPATNTAKGANIIYDETDECIKFIFK